ncbi:unnamed protein product [Paramecium sonneborni]|uniref:Uncharacterized protein n=1 Tax=Paramecium sonneborni TaxID=65129 RepID=A0A8S1QHD8_9CILI|nr:unnamed protein product [Paramecium sonneborni]
MQSHFSANFTNNDQFCLSMNELDQFSNFGEIEGQISVQNKLCKTQLKVEQRNGELRYILDGRIIKSEKIFEPKIETNIDQILHLQWIGESKNQQKQDRWYALWKGERLNSGGNYNQNGLKIGIWIELQENYWDQADIYHIGIYKNGRKYGKWKTVYMDRILGEGDYDENECKVGMWVEINKNFNDQCQIIQKGLYNQGQKIGRWDTRFRSHKGHFENIGGGYYDMQSNKQGLWVEISDSFMNDCKLTLAGLYKNNRRNGYWNIIYENKRISKYLSIGGGNYNCNGMKQGKWIEIYSNFNKDTQIFIEGEYQQGKKLGIWKIFQIYEYLQNLKIIGFGAYSEEGHKDGKWIEIFEKSNKDCYANDIGNYNKGQKVGLWETYSLLKDQDKLQKIGGGVYNANGKKHGDWIELYLLQTDYWNDSLLVLNGKYQNGLRIEKWDIKWQEYDNNNKNQIQIGGGIYNENGIKCGQWIELDQNFNSKCKVLHQGKYEQGFRIGNWKIKFCFLNTKNYIEIAGGQYNDQGLQEGKWKELHNNFYDHFQCYNIGQYQNKRKCGKWKTFYYDDSKLGNVNLGEGQYDENGMKQGKWTILHNKFNQQLYNLFTLRGKLGFNGWKIQGWNQIWILEIFSKNEILQPN